MIVRNAWVRLAVFEAAMIALALLLFLVLR